jgi:hypothetical protein
MCAVKAFYMSTLEVAVWSHVCRKERDHRCIYPEQFAKKDLSQTYVFFQPL